MFMKTLSYISTTFLGLMFLVSSFAKAWDAETFADMLLLYGPSWLSIGAPIIIFTESLLGMALFLRIHPKWSAWAAIVFLASVSIIYAYGVLYRGVGECGCFGVLSQIYTSKPWVTFIRNLMFAGIAVPPILENKAKLTYSLPKFFTIALVSAIACFICGLAMRKSFALPDLSSTSKIDNAATMEQLQKIYAFDPDSSYVVYLFSFSCVYCQNSYANVQQYQQLHLADKVLGIAIEDVDNQERFYRIYQPQIEIITIPQNVMVSITNKLPICLHIQGNVIDGMQSGMIPAPGIFVP